MSGKKLIYIKEGFKIKEIKYRYENFNGIPGL